MVQVGTAVVSRGDGRLALGRLGYLCEQVGFYFLRCFPWMMVCWLIFFIVVQIKDLNSSGYEVILVTSGAVGVGRQKLRYRKLVHSRFFFLPSFLPSVCCFFRHFRDDWSKNGVCFGSCFYSFADLQKPQMELEGKACASVGQSGLMALYDVLFNQVW